MTTIADMVAVLRAETAQFNAAIGKSQAQLAAFKGETEGVSKAATVAWVTVGIVAAAGIAKSIDATMKWASATLALQRITGQTAESASTLLAVADTMGIDVNQLGVSFSFLERQVGANTTKFQALGVATHDAQGNILPFDSLLGNVFTKFDQTAKGAAQMALAVQLFGRSGRQLIPLLALGSEGFKKFGEDAQAAGLVIGQPLVDSVFKFNMAMSTLGAQVKGIEIRVGSTFIPVLIKLADAMHAVLDVAAQIPTPVLLAAAAIAILGAGTTALLATVQYAKDHWMRFMGATVEASAAEAEATATTVGLTASMDELVAIMSAAYPEAAAAAAASAAELAAAQAEAAAAAAAESDALAGSGGGLLAGLGSIAAVTGPVVLGLTAIAAGFFLARKEAQATSDNFRAGILTDLHALQLGVPDMGQGSFNRGGGPSRMAAAGQAAQSVIALSQQPLPIAGWKLPPGGKGVGPGQVIMDPSVFFATRDAILKAKAAMDQYTSAQQLVAGGTSAVNQALNDQTKAFADSTTQIVAGSAAWTAFSASAFQAEAGLSKFSAVLGPNISSMTTDLDKLVAAGKATRDQMAAAMQKTLDAAKAAVVSFEAGISKAFGPESTLSSFFTKAPANLGQVTEALRKATHQAQEFKDNFDKLSREKAPTALLQQLAQAGPSAGAFTKMAADAAPAARKAFFDAFAASTAVSTDLGANIANTLAPGLDKWFTTMEGRITKLSGTPITLRTDPAMKNLSNLDAALTNIGNKISSLNWTLGNNTNMTHAQIDALRKAMLAVEARRSY